MKIACHLINCESRRKKRENKFKETVPKANNIHNMTEFLSLCDVLFNVVSLAGYFCDVVFDVVLSYALFERGHFTYMTFVIVVVIVSLVISQTLSLRWYLHKVRYRNRELVNTTIESNGPKKPMDTMNDSTTSESVEISLQSKIERYSIIGLHVCQLGVLWRYAKLFVPVDLRHVKHEVRDLCMLRLIHAFCEAAPMLLLQLYILVSLEIEEELNLMKPEIPLQSLGSGIAGHVAPVIIVQQPSESQQHQLQTFKDLNIVSCTLSLFSVCWALASFSKNVRIQNVHRLVLTWLGVIFQFLWRLGTVISRVAALTVYASIYKQWVFMVIAFHWISMFLWLISPKNVFHGERITRLRKISLAGLIAIVYIFAYVNLQEVNHRQKMFIFYFVMFLENTLLVFLWIIGIWYNRPDNWYMTPVWIFVSFVSGLIFMFLYYRYFHIRRLGYEAGGRLPAEAHTKYSCADGTSCISFDDNLNTCQKYPAQIPGVFNCRFTNPVGSGAARRKKKKPTTFVPPPNLNMEQTMSNNLVNQNLTTSSNTGLMAIPFWRRPITRSHTCGSENEGSAGSRVDIYQKLQEKKQKQLAELKIIEEEIKQGKLAGKLNTDDGNPAVSLPRQPIPQVKKHINIDPHEWRTSSPEFCAAGLGSLMNDLNVISSPNIDNNFNKYTRNYDPLYDDFVLNATNVSALNKKNIHAIETNQRNISPITSQITPTDSNNHFQMRQMMARTKIPHNAPRNPFADSYHVNMPNVYAENFASNSNDRAPPKMSIHQMPPPSNSNRFSPHPIPTADHDDNNQMSNSNSNGPISGGPNSQQQHRSNLQRQIQRAKTPEILLAPHYLDNSTVYNDWVDRDQSTYHIKMPNNRRQQHHNEMNPDDANEQNDYRVPSDIDSQVSLPRSYTLPREFKYHRRNKSRKFIKNERFINSTNSSDGDVDSGDDNNESEHYSHLSANSQHHQQQQQSQPHCIRMQQTGTTVDNSNVNKNTQFHPSNALMNNFNLTNDSTNPNNSNICNMNVPNYFSRTPNSHYLQQTGRSRINLNGMIRHETKL